MRWVTAYARVLQIQEKAARIVGLKPAGFVELMKDHSVHELLFDPAMGNSLPFYPALLAARFGIRGQESDYSQRTLVWVDSVGTFYPPAAMGAGVLSSRLYVVRPGERDVVWAAIECLRCRSIGAVVALMMNRPTRVEVRRLQLAAEKGGGIGLLLRPNLASAGRDIYAAATRWLVAPAPGERAIQRWSIQLIHGQGRRIGQSFLLEKHRATGQTNLVHLPAPLVHHPSISAAS